MTKRQADEIAIQFISAQAIEFDRGQLAELRLTEHEENQILDAMKRLGSKIQGARWHIVELAEIIKHVQETKY